MSGSLILVLHSHLPYVIRHGRWPHGVEWLCEATVECYIPLLDQLFALREEGVRPGITISFSPVLLEQLADDEFPAILDEYIEGRIRLAEEDLLSFQESGDKELARAAEHMLGWYRESGETFSSRYERDIIARYRDLRDAGAIALQTCGATHGYFPLLGYDQSVHAQIQVALDSHYRHFRHRPRGIWMPECAYRPEGYWAPPVQSEVPGGTDRAGIEKLIEAGGMDHTIVDAHLVRGGEAVEWYTARFRENGESGRQDVAHVPLSDPNSVYRTYQVAGARSKQKSEVHVFPRDVDSALHVWSSVTGYPGGAEYLEFHKKHHASGGRYWSVTGRDTGLEGKRVYDPERASDMVAEDARAFAGHLVSRSEEYLARTGEPASICLPFDTELFGHWWHEGPAFLGNLIREISRLEKLTMRTSPEELDRTGGGLPVTLPEGSWGDSGDHRVWLNDDTAWTWPIIWAAEKRLIDLLSHRDRSSRASLEAGCPGVAADAGF